MNKQFQKLGLVLLGIGTAGLGATAVNAAMVNINGVATNVGDETIAATNTLHRAGVTRLPLEKQNLYTSSKRWEAALLLKRFNKKVKKVSNNFNNCYFDDISTMGGDIPQEIVESCQIGLFQGGNGKFTPYENFTRGQTIIVFARMLAANKQPFRGGTYEDQINNSYDYLLKKGIIHVDDRSNHQRPVTREEMYLMMYRIVKTGKKSSNTNKGNIDIDVSIIQKTFDSIDLNQGLKGNEEKKPTIGEEKAKETLNREDTDFNIVAFYDNQTQKDGHLPTGGSRVILQKVGVKNNGKDDLVLNDVDFKLNGFVSYRNLPRVYLLSEDLINSSSASFKSTYTANVYARRGLDKVEAGKTKYYYIAVDVDNDEKISSNSFQLEYTFNFDKKDAKVGGDLTNKTIEYRFVSYTTQVMSIEGYNVPASKVYVGDEQKLIGSFNLEVGSSKVNSTRDVYLKKIILTNDGTRLEDKLKNVKFKVDGKVVSDKVEISRDKIVAEFRKPVDENDKDKKIEDTTVLLERGESLQVDVYADIIGGSNNDKIKFYLKNEGDLVAFEKGSGLPLKVSKIGSQYFREFLIQAGKMVISKSSASPIVETISPDSKEVEVLRFKVANPSTINIDQFNLFASVNNKSNDDVNIDDLFRSIKIYKCGTKDKDETCTVVDTANISSMNIPTGTKKENIKFDLSNLTRIESGDNVYAVKVQTSKFSKENVDFKFFVNKDSFVRPENERNDDTISKDSIVGSADSNYWTIGSSVINVNYMNNGEELDFVKGKANATSGEFVISSNNIQDLKINQLRLKFTSNTPSTVNYDQITNVRLEYNNNTSENRDVDSNGYVTFDSLNIRIKKGEQLKLKVKFDISSAFTNDLTEKQLTVELGQGDANLLMSTAGGQTVKHENIGGLPVVSDTVRIHSAGKLYMSKSTNQKDVKTLFNYNKFEDVFEFNLRSRYDDLRIKDLYVVAYKGAYSKDAGTHANIIEDASSFINQIKYVGGVTQEANVIKGIAKFENLNDDLKANTEKTVKIAVKSNNIRQADKDNKKVKFAVVFKIRDAANNEYKTKVVSLSNGELLNNNSVDWSDDLESKEISVRKTMIKVDTGKNGLDTKIVNGGEHKVFGMVVENLGSGKAKIKQFALPITIANTGSPMVLNNFKVEFTTDGENSFRSWSTIRDNIQFAVKKSGEELTDQDWKTPNEISITEANNAQYTLFVRFAGDYMNGIDLQGGRKIAIRTKAQISGADQSSDSVSFELKTHDDALDGDMKAYSDYSQGNAALNSVIWTDNADSNSNTNLDHVNWFEDQGIEGQYNQNTLSYHNN